MTGLSPLLTTESMFSLSIFVKVSKFSPVLSRVPLFCVTGVISRSLFVTVAPIFCSEALYGSVARDTSV